MAGIEEQRLVEDTRALDREAQPARVAPERPALATRHPTRAQRVKENQRTVRGEIEEASRAEPGAREADGGIRNYRAERASRDLRRRLAAAAARLAVDAGRSLRRHER